MNTLFHYCSNNTFMSIISGQSIWLSSLLLSNDSMEGKLLSDLIRELAVRDNLSVDKIQSLQKVLLSLEGSFDGLGFCLSQEGDLLSQWRGYAENGAGISIGFSQEYIEELCIHNRNAFSLKQVKYETNEQIEILRPTYEDMKKIVHEKDFKEFRSLTIMDYITDENAKSENEAIIKSYSTLLLKAMEFLSNFFVLKSNAFKEEREWRLIASMQKNGEDDASYRACYNRIIPYREFKLVNLSKSSIPNVILGPRNRTPHHVIKGLLNNKGFLNVEVTNSGATYLG